MSVIKVDVTALADMGKQFTRIKDDFDHIADVTKDADQYVGNADIAKALHRFTNNWSDKRQQISALLGTTATSVTKAAQAYHQSDQDAATQTGGDQQQNTTTPRHSGDQSGDAHPAGCTCGCGGDTVTGDRGLDTSTDTGTSTSTGTGTDGSVPADQTTPVDASTYPADGYTDTADTAGTTDTADPAAYTGSGDSGAGGDLGGTGTGSDPQDAAPISGQGSVSDSGDIGMSAQASGGGDTGGGQTDAGGGPGAAGMAETAAPIGLLGAAGAAAWAAQKRRDSEQNPDDEFDE